MDFYASTSTSNKLYENGIMMVNNYKQNIKIIILFIIQN